MRPPDFDSTKKYPVLFNVYGEPWGQTVRDAWMSSEYLWHLMLTQQGYIVMSIDNRGTPAPRGREWRKVVYRKIGVIASADQAAAVREIRKWPYVDASRIGIWGWSGGGSMSLNMIFRYPDLYNTAMAVAPVPDVRLYDNIYQERYMGLPQDNPDDYAQASPITFAGQLEGNLLIVHGTGDDNVHYQGTERLIDALVAANKQFSVMPYPNRSHGIYEGQGTTLHLRSLLTRYLNEHLPPGPRE
jgi:dipeptidyl-peptidase-4